VKLLASHVKDPPTFAKRQSSCMQYQKCLKGNQKLPTVAYTNDVLLKKDGTTFWKCWHSKFVRVNKCSWIEGSVNSSLAADKCVNYFQNTFSLNRDVWLALQCISEWHFVLRHRVYIFFTVPTHPWKYLIFFS